MLLIPATKTLNPPPNRAKKPLGWKGDGRQKMNREETEFRCAQPTHPALDRQAKQEKLTFVSYCTSTSVKPRQGRSKGEEGAQFRHGSRPFIPPAFAKMA